MNIAYFDCFSGIAGDMALAALLDCGVPLEELKQGLRALPVNGWEIDAAPVLTSGIHALSARITLNGVSDEDELAAILSHRATHAGRDHPHGNGGHSHDHDHDHDHDLEGDHDHPHEHGHEHDGDHAHHHAQDRSHGRSHGRSMAEIRQLIEASALSSGVKRRSLAIFGQIAAAEAKMHHTTVEEVHFHEIGGLDSLLDIVGVAWCLEYLGVERIYCSALPLSSGWVDCAHGRMPVPAPATLEILKGATWTPTDLRGELVTPTGAGILAALVDGYGPPPALVATRVGAGAGKKQLPDRPNILRVIVGEPAASPRTHLQPPAGATLGALLEDGLEWRDLQLLESNIDDLNPELWDTVFERLLEAGALDVWLAPIQMKKNRPAQQLGVLCESSKQDAVMRVVLRETTTLGVRVGTVRRAALPRGIREVSTAYGLVRVKVTRWAQGDLERGVPEYEDVKRLSREKGIPAREVYEAALRAL